MKELPEWSKCVWKWKLFSVREWEQKMYDGTTQIFECVKRFDSIQWVMIDGDKIILPYEIQPHQIEWNYGLRGGMMEDDEVPQEAMAREFLEETGMVGDIMFWQSFSKGWATKWNEYYYTIKNPKKIQEAVWDWWEKIEMKYLSFSEFIDVLLQPGFRNGNFSWYIMREYLYPRKEEELKKLLFG